jgi:NADH:ubiquinone oxidoreductase subunit E
MENQPPKASKATIKVCIHKDCCQKGSETIYENLRDAFSTAEARVLKVDDCMSMCALGPNIALNDNIVTGIKPFSAVEQVKAELNNPSCKADGLGNKPLSSLDDFLEDLEKL